jgi:UDP-glucose 4-epimerase
VAVGRLEALQIFGNDYPTPDGTGIRDYIHVVDLAKGHVKAVEFMLSASTGCNVFNLGAGKGYSVLEVVAAFEQASGKAIPYRFAPRREGDLASYYANANRALVALGWKTEYDMQAMVEDTWRWQSNNPNGFNPS